MNNFAARMCSLCIAHSSPQPPGAGNRPAQGSRNRQTSSQRQDAQDSSRPSTRRKVADKQTCCNSNLGFKHTTPTISRRLSKSMTSPQPTQKGVVTPLRVNKRADKIPPTTRLAQCNDAQLCLLLFASN